MAFQCDVLYKATFEMDPANSMSNWESDSGKLAVKNSFEIKVSDLALL